MQPKGREQEKEGHQEREGSLASEGCWTGLNCVQQHQQVEHQGVRYLFNSLTGGENGFFPFE